MGKKKRAKLHSIDPAMLGDIAEIAISAAEKEMGKGGGKAKKRRAIRLLAEQIDTATEWGPGPIGVLAEVVDSQIIWFLGMIIQGVFNRKRKKTSK